MGTSPTVLRTNRPLLANDPVPLPCSVTPEELHCLNYCQKEMPSIHYVQPRIGIWGRQYVVLSCSRLNKSSLHLSGECVGAAHQEAHRKADLLPAEVPIRRTGVEGWSLRSISIFRSVMPCSVILQVFGFSVVFDTDLYWKNSCQKSLAPPCPG